MKNMKRILLTMVAAMLLVVMSVGGTLAYLQSTTEEVKNTFTVGHVTITLDEGDVWEAEDEGTEKADGTVVTEEDLGKHKDAGASRVQTNNYDLFPGHTYDKDPKIHVDAKSEDCYVVAKVTVTAKNITNLRKQFAYAEGVNLLGLNGYVTGGVFADTTLEMPDDVKDGSVYESDTYILEQKANTADNTFYIYFKKPQVAGAELTLFTNIAIPETWTADDLANLDGLKIDVIAYAIQADQFTDVKTAFAAGKFEQ